MARKQNTAVAAAPENGTDGEGATREDLHRRMDEARDSIAQTVTEIKDAVVDEYQSVKESVSDALDWREQFRSHPLAWSIGALSVGYVIGSSFANAFKGDKDNDELLSHLAALGDRFTDELSKRGMSILAPALTGTILVPMLTSKINEIFGIDLSDISDQLIGQNGSKKKARAKGTKKKNGHKKGGKKKSKKT